MIDAVPCEQRNLVGHQKQHPPIPKVASGRNTDGTKRRCLFFDLFLFLFLFLSRKKENPKAKTDFVSFLLLIVAVVVVVSLITKIWFKIASESIVIPNLDQAYRSLIANPSPCGVEIEKASPLSLSLSSLLFLLFSFSLIGSPIHCLCLVVLLIDCFLFKPTLHHNHHTGHPSNIPRASLLPDKRQQRRPQTRSPRLCKPQSNCRILVCLSLS